MKYVYFTDNAAVWPTYPIPENISHTEGKCKKYKI